MPISPDLYRQIGRSTAGAVSVICTYPSSADSVVGLTCSSFVTLSFSPPLVMFAIQHDANCHTAMVASAAFGVSLLSAEHSAIARRFAKKDPEKTAGMHFEPGVALRVPLIPSAIVQIECETENLFKSGDHAIVVGRVEAARVYPGRPLLYYSQVFGTFAPLPD